MSDQIFQKVITWATAEEAIRVVIMEGSHARPEQTPDRFSDYDLDLYVNDTTHFTQDDTWLAQFGQIWAMEKESALAGVISRLVLFAGGQGVDFRFLPIGILHELIQQQRLPDDYHRGYQVLLDKEGIIAQLPPPSYQAVPQRKPSAEEFHYAVNVFWFELFHLVKYLHRNDLWSVKFRDAVIKRRLLQMIEWHTQAHHHWQCDTWIVGKNMQSWVAPDLWQAFFGIFAHFDKEDSWRAVCALLPLYRRLAGETAQRLNYPYLAGIDQAISEFIMANPPLLFTAET